MSPRQWLALLCFYTAYLFFGASFFYHTEHEFEKERRVEALQARIDIHGECEKSTPCGRTRAQRSGGPRFNSRMIEVIFECCTLNQCRPNNYNHPGIK